MKPMPRSTQRLTASHSSSSNASWCARIAWRAWHMVGNSSVVVTGSGMACWRIGCLRFYRSPWPSNLTIR